MALAPIFPENALTVPPPVDLGCQVRIDVPPTVFRSGRVATLIQERVGKRSAFTEANLALITEYDATSLYDPDPSPPGRPRSKSAAACQQLQLANLSLWLARPTDIHFNLLIDLEYVIDTWCLARDPTVFWPGVVTLPRYGTARLTGTDIDVARDLLAALSELTTKGTGFVASRYLWLALNQEMVDASYGLLWIAVEALLGPENRKRIGERISMRGAAMIGGDRTQQALTYHRVSEGWRARNEVMHGDTLEERSDPEKFLLLWEAHELIRGVLRRVLTEPAVRDPFSTFSDREAFLQELERGFTAPAPEELAAAQNARWTV
jgi:hypothetical protein